MTHRDVSGIKLNLVHSVTAQSVIARAITDERTHESTLFKTGSWMRGRLFLLDLGFFKYRRFPLIDENDGFFVSRLKQSANSEIVRELREWRGRTIPLEGAKVFDVVGDLCQEQIDVEVEVRFQRREYNESRRGTASGFESSTSAMRTPTTAIDCTSRTCRFSPEDVSTLYRARWVVELLFRELKSQYGLGRFQTGKEHIVRIQVTAALLTLVVSRAILRLFVDHAQELGDKCVFPTERWATNFRSPSTSSLRSLFRSITTQTFRIPVPFRVFKSGVRPSDSA